jgi:hypothetical protein
MDVICDIDGTLADLTHRRHWVATKPKNWKAFFQNIEQDKPIDPVIQVIKSLYFDQYEIVFCSGRGDEHRDVTRVWLARHIGEWAEQCPLYMRAQDDFRADDIIKEELLAQIRKDGYDPKIAFDDRDRVVAMWRRNGIQCFRVAEGNF